MRRSRKEERGGRMLEPYCGEYLGYSHLSGNKAYCGDDVVTHIVRCDKCKKKLKDGNQKGDEE